MTIGVNVKKPFFFVANEEANKLERLSQPSISSLFQYWRVRAREELLEGATLGLALALLASFRQRWKGLQGTHALAYLASLSMSILQDYEVVLISLKIITCR
jgi:hypothetical protein